MRIVHVPYGFGPDPVGGTELYVAALARHQASRGAAPLIAAPAAAPASYTHAGLAVRRFAIQGRLSLAELYGAGDPTAAAGFAAILDAERPDIVHLHAFSSAVSPLLARAAHARGLPVIFTYHTPTVSCQRGTLLRWGREVCDGALLVSRCAACALHGHGAPRAAAVAAGALPPSVGRALGAAGAAGGLWTALRMSALIDLRHAALTAMLAEADAVVALCAWSRALLERIGVPPARLTLSRHGLTEWPRPTAPGRQGGPPLRIAFLGRLDPAKGADLLIGAVRALPGAALALDLFGVTQPGGEAYAAGLRRLAAGDGRIRLMPPVGGGEAPALLAGYDLLAVPSRVLETGPLVVLEAFAAGTPVLGAALGGIAELVTDGVDGLLATPDAPAAWRDALARLAAEPALLARLRAGVRPPRPIADAGDEQLALYERLAARPAPPSMRQPHAAI